jgi:hypothetical protein
MTIEESMKLKVGNKVCYLGDEADHGRVTAAQFRYVTIKWADGHGSFTAHKHMASIEPVRSKP